MTYSTLYLWCVGNFLPAAADGFVEVEQVEAGGELVVEQVLAEAVGAELGLQGGVEGFAAVAEELAVVAHLLFGAGELGAAGLDFGGAGAQVGALVEEAAGPDALWRAGEVLQQGGLAHGVAIEAEGLRGLADEYGDAALLGVELGLQGLDLGGNGGGVVGGGVAGVEAAGGVACQFVQGGKLLGNEGLLLLDVGGAQVVFGDLGGDEQAAAVELLLAAEGGGAGGIGIAAFLAEDVGLPGGAEAGGGELAAVAEVGVAAVVAVAFGIGGETGAGQEVGFGQAGGGAGFF